MISEQRRGLCGRPHVGYTLLLRLLQYCVLCCHAHARLGEQHGVRAADGRMWVSRLYCGCCRNAYYAATPTLDWASSMACEQRRAPFGSAACAGGTDACWSGRLLQNRATCCC